MQTQWLALDVGGANLKAADGLGYAATRPFALWREPDRLAAELASLIAAAPAADRLAVTMTGELCDCFQSKAAGVEAILTAAEAAAAAVPISVYLTDGRFVDPAAAAAAPLLAAASNWHALAAFCGRLAGDGAALLVDMGSTTTDVIPLAAAGPLALGRTDSDRLLSGELVYTGVERTPVMAVVDCLPWRGKHCPIAAELFATTADAYVLLGALPEDRARTDTADGKPRTLAAARTRLARMICGDDASFSQEDAIAAASAIREAQLATIRAAVNDVVQRLAAPPRTVIVSGQGEFLLRQLADDLPWRPEVISLNTVLGPEPSRCAPAHAVAVLARQRLEGAGQ